MFTLFYSYLTSLAMERGCGWLVRGSEVGEQRIDLVRTVAARLYFRRASHVGF